MSGPAKYDISMYRGDDFSLVMDIADGDDVGIDMSGGIVLMQIRKSADSPDVLATLTTIISDSLDELGNVTVVNGRITATLDGATISGIDFGRHGDGVYDLQLTLSGVVETYIYGNVTIPRDVSK